LAYYYLKEYDKVIADCTEAIKIDPTWFGTYQLRGDAYKAKGDMTRANEDYAAAERIKAQNK
jgi:tetratricopeptide (TPR) repeat protein